MNNNNQGLKANEMFNKNVEVHNHNYSSQVNQPEVKPKDGATTIGKCFISFAGINMSFAIFVKRIISKCFGGATNVFVAGDDESITPGQKWADEIQNSVVNSSTHIVLLTPTSIENRWVNIELGIAWANQIKIVPICFDGLTINKLPVPLNHFQAIQLYEPLDAIAIEHLIGQLAKVFGDITLDQQQLKAFCVTEVDAFGD